MNLYFLSIISMQCASNLGIFLIRQSAEIVAQKEVVQIGPELQMYLYSLESSPSS